MCAEPSSRAQRCRCPVSSLDMVWMSRAPVPVSIVVGGLYARGRYDSVTFNDVVAGIVMLQRKVMKWLPPATTHHHSVDRQPADI
nr:hypothetical protein CFP56_62514 [Quercus suber]